MFYSHRGLLWQLPHDVALKTERQSTTPQCRTMRGRLRLKRDGTGAEIIFRLSAKRTSPLKLAGASVQSTTGSRGVRISGSNAGYTMFRGSVKGTVYPLHSPVSPSRPLPCVTVCHHISTELCLFIDWFIADSITATWHIRIIRMCMNHRITNQTHYIS